MGEFSRFLKLHREEKANVRFAATTAFKDEDGNPWEWEFKPLSTAEHDRIRDNCMVEAKVRGKKGMTQPKLDMSKYIAKMMVACTVEPDLHEVELQDSYGVMSAEDLIKELIPNPGEYGKLSVFLQEYNGFDVIEGEMVEEAKN